MITAQDALATRAMDSQAYFAMERANDVLIVVLGRRLGSLCGSELLEERAVLIEETGRPAIRAVVFDFETVEYFDSLLLDTLCQVWQCLRERGAQLTLCSVPEFGLDILRNSRLDSLWSLHSSRQNALEAVGSTQSATVMP
jgi:anti-anti-sigma factor